MKIRQLELEYAEELAQNMGECVGKCQTQSNTFYTACDISRRTVPRLQMQHPDALFIISSMMKSDEESLHHH